MDRYRQSCSPVFFWLLIIFIALINLSYSNSYCGDTSATTGNEKTIKREVQGKEPALLVGINDYAYVTKLKGAVNRTSLV